MNLATRTTTTDPITAEIIDFTVGLFDWAGEHRGPAKRVGALDGDRIVDLIGADGTRAPDRYLKPGDVVEVESPLVGRLQDRVV